MNKEEKVSEQLNESAETVKSGVESKSVAGASGKIDYWIKTLENKDGFKTISGSLEKLKTAIKEKNSEHICDLLEKLGEATVKKSELDGVDDSSSIKKLGKALISDSQSLKKLSGK